MSAKRVVPSADDAHQALAAKVQAQLDDFYLSSADLCARWGYKATTLANQRSQMIGLPFTKLPGGKVVYRASDVIAAELAGYTGAESPSVISAIECFPGLDSQTRRALIRHIKQASVRS